MNLTEIQRLLQRIYNETRTSRPDLTRRELYALLYLCDDTHMRRSRRPICDMEYRMHPTGLIEGYSLRRLAHYGSESLTDMDLGVGDALSSNQLDAVLRTLEDTQGIEGAVLVQRAVRLFQTNYQKELEIQRKKRKAKNPLYGILDPTRPIRFR